MEKEIKMVEYKTMYPKEVHELGLFVGKILEATGKALEDGFQPGDDLPQIIASPLTELMLAVQGLKELPAEFKEAPVTAAMGIVAPCADGVQKLLKSMANKE
jgi:hypothetical protein